MGLNERIDRIEERLALDNGSCVLFVDEDEAGRVIGDPKCPKGRELSKGLHECKECRLVPDREKTQIHMIEVGPPDRLEPDLHGAG